MVEPVRDDHTPYLVHLCVTGYFPVQFAFQLAHELGHIMIETRVTNSLVEVLTTAISYQALDDLSTPWGTLPTRHVEQGFAHHFADHRSTYLDHTSSVTSPPR